MNRSNSILRRFGRDTRGVSAMEFAILLPVMLLFVAGTVDINEGLTVHRKIRQISSVIVDLVSQSDKLTQSEVATILTGAAKILDPYPGVKLSIIVSVIDVKNKKKQTVKWSAGYQATPHAKNTPANVPNDLTDKNVELVRAEIGYSFTTMFSGYLAPIIGRDGYVMSDVMYQRPRVSEEIKLVGS
jgi:Flp pilus assembly protein TadG